MSASKQIEKQAETIKAQWVKIIRLEKRCDTLQRMADWQGKTIENLQAQLTAEAIAERIFKDGQ